MHSLGDIISYATGDNDVLFSDWIRVFRKVSVQFRELSLRLVVRGVEKVPIATKTEDKHQPGDEPVGSYADFPWKGFQP